MLVRIAVLFVYALKGFSIASCAAGSIMELHAAFLMMKNTFELLYIIPVAFSIR